MERFGRDRSVYHRPMPGPSADVGAFILAGGNSSRMGADKAFLRLDGRTMLAHALHLAQSVTVDVRIVGAPAKFEQFAPVVEDIFPGCGPLGGIHAALRASSAPLNLMLAVDVPFASPALLQYLTERARASTAAVTVPRVSRRLQPLCAIYRLEFADVAEVALRSGRYKIDACFDLQQTQVVDENELQARGFSVKMFRNLNTPADLEQAHNEMKMKSDHRSTDN